MSASARAVDGARRAASVLARDPASGDLGIAVSSCILAVGAGTFKPVTSDETEAAVRAL